MIVDELLIPDREGTIRIPLDERVTVFAGLDADARARLADLVVGALAGRGPGCARVRDALGQTALVSALGTRHDDGRVAPGPVPAVAADEAHLRRMVLVSAADVGLGPDAPDPLLAAERTAVAAAHHQMEAELAAIEAAAAGGGDVDGLRERRRDVAARLARVDAALDDAPSDPAPDDLGTGVMAARAVLLGIAAMRDGMADPRDDGPLASALAAEEALARADLVRATAELAIGRRAVAEELAAIDRELAEQGHDADDDGRPTADDVRAARRRVQIASAHLARLGGAEPPVDRVRNVLLGRAAALRPDGTSAVLPLVLDDPLVALDPGTRCDLLGVLARVAERAQLLVLTGDEVTLAWARPRAERGELRLVEVATVAAR